MKKSEIINSLNEKLASHFEGKSVLKASELTSFTLVEHIHLFVYSTDKQATWKFDGKLKGESLFIEGKYQGDDWKLVRA
jgi:hypothetical protein